MSGSQAVEVGILHSERDIGRMLTSGATSLRRRRCTAALHSTLLTRLTMVKRDLPPPLPDLDNHTIGARHPGLKPSMEGREREALYLIYIPVPLLLHGHQFHTDRHAYHTRDDGKTTAK